MSNGSIVATGDQNLTERIYGDYSVVGGKSSEGPLRRTWSGFLGHGVMKDKKVLVTGVGDAIEAGLVLDESPSELWLTDYCESAALAAEAKLLLRGERTKLVSRRLDVSDVSPISDELYDAIFCNSVLMHLPLPKSTDAILDLASLLRPGGTLCVGVFASEVAREKFYPLTETVGPDWFCPQLRGLRSQLGRRPTEHDIPDGAAIHEFYPERVEEQYARACAETGFQVTCHPATIQAGECQDSIYKNLVGKPLWYVYQVVRPLA